VKPMANAKDNGASSKSVTKPPAPPIEEKSVITVPSPDAGARTNGGAAGRAYPSAPVVESSSGKPVRAPSNGSSAKVDYSY